MTKIVYEKEMTLFPCLDKNPYHVIADILSELSINYPDYKNLTCNVYCMERENGTTYLRIRLLDKLPTKSLDPPSLWRDRRFVFWCLVISLILTLTFYPYP